MPTFEEFVYNASRGSADSGMNWSTFLCTCVPVWPTPTEFSNWNCFASSYQRPRGTAVTLCVYNMGIFLLFLVSKCIVQTYSSRVAAHAATHRRLRAPLRTLRARDDFRILGLEHAPSQSATSKQKRRAYIQSSQPASQ